MDNTYIQQRRHCIGFLVNCLLYGVFSNDFPWHFHGHTYPPQGVPENSAIKSVLDYNIVFNPLPSGAASYIALGKKKILLFI